MLLSVRSVLFGTGISSECSNVWSFLAVIYLTMPLGFASVNHVCVGKVVKAKFFLFH